MHLYTALLDTLATEAELNRVTEYEGMICDGDKGNVEGRVDGAVEQAKEDAATAMQVPTMLHNEDAEEEDVQPDSEDVDVQPVMPDDEEDAEDAVEAEVIESSSDNNESLTLTQLGKRAQIQQAKGDVTCNCKGPCNTDRCLCKKAGRICSSACHRNNFKCINHDRHD